MSRTNNTRPYDIQKYDRSLPGAVYHDHLEREYRQKPDGTWIRYSKIVPCDYSSRNGAASLHENQSRVWPHRYGIRCEPSIFWSGGCHYFGGHAKYYRTEAHSRIRRQANDTMRLMAREGAATELEIVPTRESRRHIVYRLT